MSYSPTLSIMMDRVAGFSTNSYKLQVLGSSSAGPNQIVRFEMPSNSLIDIRKLAMKFRLAVTGTQHARLGSSVSSIIERVSITVGGTELNSGFSKYNVLHQIKRALMEDDCGENPLNTHPEITRTKSLSTGAAYTAAGGEPATDYVIDNWLGFLGECEPRVLDTSKFAPIQVSITLAPAQAVVVQAAAASTVAEFTTAGNVDATYSLTDIYATIPTLNFASGLYDQMLNAIMAKQGFLEIPYKSYVVYSDVGGSVKWNCASSSLDRIWTATRDVNHNTAKVPVLLDGYNGEFDKVYNYADEKYQSTFYNFPAPASTAGITSQHTINSSLVPQYAMTQMDAAIITKQSVPRKYQSIHGVATMNSNLNCSCLRLNMEGSEGLRIASGLDSRGIALTGIFTLNNLNNQTTPIDVFIETTNTLRVGENLLIEVVN